MKIVAIIQARMGSSRLPGKVLLEIAGKPMLQHVLERTQQADLINQVVIATTTEPADDPVASFAVSMAVSCSRGALHDVLDRYYQAAKAHQADVVVRVTGDCPVIDPHLINETIKQFLLLKLDFAANRLPPPFKRTYPIGLDVEVCSFEALEKAWAESAEGFHREHVMPFIYEGVQLKLIQLLIETGFSQRGFKIGLMNHEADFGTLRWTVDTPEDLAFMREVFKRLKDSQHFSWLDVLAIVQAEPELAKINAEVRHKTMTEIDERQK